jgi:hypothetical protein
VNNITGLINTSAVINNFEYFNDPLIIPGSYAPIPQWNGIQWQNINTLAGITTNGNYYWQPSGPQYLDYAMLLQGTGAYLSTGAVAIFQVGVASVFANIDVGQQFYINFTAGTPSNAAIRTYYELSFSSNGASGTTVYSNTLNANTAFADVGPLGPYTFTSSNGFIQFSTASSAPNDGILLVNRLNINTNSNATDGMTLSNVNVIDSTSNLPLVIGAASESVDVKNWSANPQQIPSIRTGEVSTFRLTGLNGKQITVVPYVFFGGAYNGYVSRGNSGDLCNATYSNFPRSEWGAVVCPETTENGDGVASNGAAIQVWEHAIDLTASNYRVAGRVQNTLSMNTEQPLFVGKLLLFPLNLVDYCSQGPPVPP